LTSRDERRGGISSGRKTLVHLRAGEGEEVPFEVGFAAMRCRGLRRREALPTRPAQLEPIFEADLDDAAYGYRPERSGVQAVQQVHQELGRGRTEVVDAELSKYFDTIPHAELMKCVARRIADKAVLHLVKMWLKVPIEERDELGRPRYSGDKRSKQGTPQGGVISPLRAE
jgi:retron-type reverse transcriptase